MACGPNCARRRSASSFNGSTCSRRSPPGATSPSPATSPDTPTATPPPAPSPIAGNRNGNSRAEMQAVIKMLGLEARMGHRPYELSGGEQQRVAIARAVVNRPKIILADEPTGNLDTKSGTQILDLLDRLNDEGLTLVVVTHDPNVARRADRAILMVDGAIARRMKGGDLPAIVVS